MAIRTTRRRQAIGARGALALLAMVALFSILSGLVPVSPSAAVAAETSEVEPSSTTTTAPEPSTTTTSLATDTATSLPPEPGPATEEELPAPLPPIDAQAPHPSSEQPLIPSTESSSTMAVTDPIPEGLWDTSPAVGPTQSYVALHGNQGDYIVGGRDALYTKATAQITVSEAEGRLSVRVHGAEKWLGELYPPDLTLGLEAGRYYEIPPEPTGDPVALVYWSGEGRGCNGNNGWIAVDELTRVDGQITTLTLRFFHRCDSGPGAFGKVRWNAADTTGPPPAPPIPAGLWDARASVNPGQSYVLIDEPFGRPVPGTQDLLYTKSDAKIEVIATPDGGVLVRVRGDLDWHGNFDPVDTEGPLRAGRYYGPTQHDPFNSPASPGLSWSGAGSACNDSTGWFAIDELVRTGDQITKLTIRFSQTCTGGKPMFGKVHWNSTDRTAPPGPRLIPYDLWDADPGVDGDYLFVEGAPGDFISQGRDWLMTADDTTFKVTPDRWLVQVEAEGPSGIWRGSFAAMDTLPELQVGYYPDLRRWPFGNAVKGMLSLSGASRSCNDSVGWMAVDEIVRVDETITRLVLRFEQSCQGGPPLHGKLVWGADDVPLPPGDPFGSLDEVTIAPGGVRVSGWAIDPDTASGIPVIYSIDQTTAAAWAAAPRPDVAAAYPGYGEDHGFSAVLPASPGPHRVCVSVYSFGGGPTVGLGCRTITVPPPSPFGSLDLVRAVPGGVQVGGWAIDPDTGESTPVHVYAGALGTALTAAGARPDLSGPYPAYGTAHGFSGQIAALPGRQQVCAYAINVAAGDNSLLGCRTVDVPSASPTGSFDVARAGPSSIVVGGWAFDPETTASIPVHVYVGAQGTALTTGVSRPDVAAAYPGQGSSHGFLARIQATPGRHQVCAYAINVAAGDNSFLGCRTVDVPSASPTGSFDVARAGPSSIVVGGWAFDPETTASIPVHVYVGAQGTALTTGVSRPDVAAAYPGQGSSHGFLARIQATPGRHQVCAYAINVAAGDNSFLGCRTVDVPSGSPIGSIDVARGAQGSVIVGGWALDPDTAEPISVHVYVGAVGVAVEAASSRPDVGTFFAGWGNAHGYDAIIRSAAGAHDVCVYAINLGPGGTAFLGCRRVVVT